MTSLELIQFRHRFKFNQQEAAKALGCSPKAIFNWERGITQIPKSIALAATAVAMGLPPYGEQKITQRLWASTYGEKQ